MVEIVAGAGLGLERTSGWLLGSQGEVGDPTFGRYGENVYVNAATGNLVIERKDEVLFGVGNGLDSEFDSVYNSMAPKTDENGDKWQLSTARHVSLSSGTINTAGSTVQRIDADGSDTLYTWNSSTSRYVCTQLGDANDTITYNATSGNWTWTDGATQFTETYKDSLNGYIAKRTDTLGNQLTYAYQTNANGHLILSATGDPLLTRVTTADGEYTDLGYDQTNKSNLISLTTTLADGTVVQRITYGYDSSNRLSTVSIDLTEANQTDQNNSNKIDILTYTYDQGSDRVASITGDDGSSLKISYNNADQVKQLTQTSSTNVTCTTSFDYSTPGQTTITDATNQTIVMIYDGQNRLKELDMPPPQSGGAVLKTKITYVSGSDNHIASVTDPMGRTTSYGYDTNGNRTLIRDALGDTITRTYDATTNAILTEVRWAGPDPDGGGSQQPTNPEVTRYIYNGKDQLSYVISAEGEVTEYDYGTSTLITKAERISAIIYRDHPYDTTGLGVGDLPTKGTMDSWASGLPDLSTIERTDWTYDFRGNLSTATTYSACDASTGAGDTSQAKTIMTYVYDQAGQLLSRRTSGIGNTELFTYDGLFRLTSVTDRNGLLTKYSYNDEQRTLTVNHTGTGLTETSLYDQAGELISYTVGSQTSTPEITTYSYDPDGRLRMVTDAIGNASGVSPSTRSSYFIYDADGRKVADVAADGSVVEYGYDADGELIYTHGYANRLAFGTNSAMAKLYAASGNLPLASAQPTADTTNDVWSWRVYDNAGRVTQTVDGAGDVVHFTYDGESRLIGTTAFANKLSASTLGTFRSNSSATFSTPTAASGSAHDAVSRNFYDKDGRLVGVLDGDGYLTQTVYDAAGEVVETIAYASLTGAGQRASGSLTQLINSMANTSGEYTRAFYDDRGLLAYTVDANLRPTGYVYDNAGHVVSATQYNGTLTAPSGSWSLAYVSAQTGGAAMSQDAQNRISFSVYDVSSGNADYEVDASGMVTQYSYNSFGQVIKTVQMATTTNQTSRHTPAWWDAYYSNNASATQDRVTRYFYDTLDHLIYVMDGENYVTQYGYDLNNRKTSEIRYAGTYTVIDTTTTSQLAAQLPSTPPASARQLGFSYDADGRLSFSTDGNGTQTSYSYDGLGRLTDQTVASNTSDPVITHYTYDGAGHVASKVDAYGSIVPGSSPAVALQTTTYYTYDGRGNVLTETTGIYQGDTTGVTTTYTYDAAENLLSVTKPASGTISYTYDAFGNAISETDALNNVSYSCYDALDRLIWQTDTDSYVTQTTYGFGDEIATVTRYYDKATNVAAGTPPTVQASITQDETTTFGRDQLGRLTSVSDAQGFSEAYQLDAFGDRVQVTNKLGGMTYNLFDRRGLLIQETLPISSINNAGNSAAVVNTFSYDARGNLLTKVEAYGFPEQRTTSYVYDHDDRLIQTVGDVVHVIGENLQGQNDMAPTQNYAYDARGNMTASSDAAGNLTLFYYDDLNRKVAEVDPAGTLSTWSYDGRGNIASAKVYSSQLTNLPTDPTGVTAMIYRLYTVCLNRLPYASEVAFWTDQMNQHAGATQPASESWPAVDGYGENMAAFEAICTSILQDSYVQANLGAADNSQFVTQLYNCAFHRAPTSDEVSYRAGQLNNHNWSRGGLLAFFCEYNDHRTIANAVIAASFTGGTPPAGTGDCRTTTYIYDASDRLCHTTVAGVLVGSFSGNTYTTATTDLVTTDSYDLNGNLVSQIDARGATSYFYYDNLGRKTAEVDADRYLTTYVLDPDGNVTRETRYSSAIPSGTTVNTSSNVTDLVSGATGASGYDSTQNRITAFTYDLDGRRLTESRLNVVVATIATDGGLNTPTTVTSTIHYTYNGLGEVLSKQEANGDTTTYGYDAMGRETRVAAPSYTDYLGNMVTPTTTNSYDGLNDLTRTAVTDPGGTYTARVTTFSYGAGGRLASTKDASGFTRSYGYDAAGRVISESYSRLHSDGTTTTEANVYRYDAAGRVTFQAVAAQNTDGSWSYGDQALTRYDAFGEVVGKALSGDPAGSGATTLCQVQYAYDNAGRMWRSNAGDGTTRLYVYDANGNQTLEIASAADVGGTAPISLNGQTLAYALGLFTGNGDHGVGDAYVAGLSATITVYDARNQATQTRMPFRDLTGSTQMLEYSNRSYDAFGEVAKETDSYGHETDYSYNTMGKLVQTQLPTVSWTDEHGNVASAAPTQNDFYDISGRLVGVEDADGNVNTLALLAGSGHGGDDAIVRIEYHADGGKVQNAYDVFGDLRTSRDEVNKTESYSYDAMDRLTEQDHQLRGDGTTQLIDYYAYDGLGQRIKSWNNYFMNQTTHQPTQVETTDYDLQGRVVSMVDLGGDTTSYAYAWNGSLTTAGLGHYGGWVKTTTNSAGLTATESTDYFGRVIGHRDYGQHQYGYTFDAAGELVEATNTLSSAEASALGLAAGSHGEVDYLWYDTGAAREITSGTLTSTFNSNAVTYYQYDKNGRRTYEWHQTLDGGGVWRTREEASVTWDADGRMLGYTDPGATGGRAATIAWTYDLAGNVREMQASYYALDDQGAVAGTVSSQDYWYAYDPMNRFTTVEGILDGNQIVRGGQGTDLTWNPDGTRATATYDVTHDDDVDLPPGVGGGGGGGGGGGQTQAVGGGAQPDGVSDGTYYTLHKETYTYTADGYLATVRFQDGTESAPTTLGALTLAAAYTRDAMGRVDDYKEYAQDGSGVAYEKTDTYDAKSDVGDEVVTTVTGGNTDVTSTHFSYTHGVMLHSSSATTENGQGVSSSYTDTVLDWWDQGETASIATTLHRTANPDLTNSSTYAYDALGHLASVSIQDERPRTVTFVTDADGTILQRDEVDQLGTGDPRDLYYYFNGIRIGDVSNNGTSDVDYVQSLAVHVAAQGTGPFRGGSADYQPYADFDQSFDPVNGLTYDNVASRYTVQAGDTLQSIAQSVWGDSSLWYLIADANGLDGSETLPAGQDLIIPNKVHNLHNTSSVYRVYDPNDAIGNTSPATPRPQPTGHHGGCGIVGEILTAIVAVAASYLVGPILGDVVKQGFANLIGEQHGFSFKELATTAIETGIDFVAPFGGGILGAALDDAATQGIAVATGLQDKFDWAGVAAAGVGGLANSAAGGGILGGIANALGQAATRSVLTGTDFGDNILKVLPNVIAQTAGGLLEREESGWGDPVPDDPQADAAAATGAPVAYDDADDGTTNGTESGWAAADAADANPNTPVADATSDGNAATGLAQGMADQRQSAVAAAQDDSAQEIVVTAAAQDKHNAQELSDTEFAYFQRLAKSQNWDGGDEYAAIADYLAQPASIDPLGDLESGALAYGGKLLGFGGGVVKGAYNSLAPIAQAMSGNYTPLFREAAGAVGAIRSGAAFTALPRAIDQLTLHDNPEPFGEIVGGSLPGLVGGAAIGAAGTTFEAGAYTIDAGTAAEGESESQTFYRGDASARSTFLSDVADARGVNASDELIASAQQRGSVSQLFEDHAISSSGSPFISLSSSEDVAQFFAKGVNGDQAGTVTVFRLPRGFAEPNFENLNAWEREYLAPTQIDSQHIIHQYQVAPR